MKTTAEERGFRKFFLARNELIDRLEDGSIDKRAFLQENLALIERLHMRPFTVLNSYERCMYNYQYYNVLAKHYNTLAQEQGQDRKGRRNYERYMNKVRNYYVEKDKATKRLLEVLDYRGIEAYPLLVRSTRLNERLFEIRVIEKERAILHSMCEIIKASLIARGVYQSEPKESIIDSYVNIGY